MLSERMKNAVGKVLEKERTYYGPYMPARNILDEISEKNEIRRLKKSAIGYLGKKKEQDRAFERENLITEYPEHYDKINKMFDEGESYEIIRTVLGRPSVPSPKGMLYKTAVGEEVPQEDRIGAEKGGLLQQFFRQFVGSAIETGISLTDLIARTRPGGEREVLINVIDETLAKPVEEFKGVPEGTGGYIGATLGSLAEFITEMWVASGILKPITAPKVLKLVSKIPTETKLGKLAQFVSHKILTDVPVFTSVMAVREKGGVEERIEGGINGLKMALVFSGLSAVPGGIISLGTLARVPLGNYLLGTNPIKTYDILRDEDISNEDKLNRLVDTAINTWFSRKGYTTEAFKALEMEIAKSYDIETDKLPELIQQKINDIKKEIPVEKKPEKVLERITKEKLPEVPVEKKVIKPIKYKTELDNIKREIESGRPGERRPIRDSEGNIIDWTGEPSTYPEYYKNKGLERKSTLRIIDKAIAGKKLTERQRSILDDLIRGAREERIKMARAIEEARPREKKTETINEMELEKGDKFKIEGEDYEVAKKTDEGVILVNDKIIEVKDFGKVEIDKGSLEKAKTEVKPLKEAWQMTKEEFENKAIKEWYKGQKFIDREKQLYNIRKEVIKTALDEGKPVPPEVLKDYPDLLKKAEPEKVAEKEIEIDKKFEQAIKELKRPEFITKEEIQKILKEKKYTTEDIEKMDLGDILNILRKEKPAEKVELKRPPTKAEIEIPEEKRPYPTTALFVTKDVKTGEKILKNESVWYYPELGGMVKEGTHKILFQQYQKTGKLFYEGEIERAKIPEKKEVPEVQERLFEKEKEPVGMLERKHEISLAPEAEIPETINKTQILQWTQRAFNIPIRGRVTHKFKDLGRYYPEQAIVRMKQWGELAVMSHEVAHHLDYKLKKKLGDRWRWENADKETRKSIVKELADLDYEPKKRRTLEGFAEFMRYYLTTDLAKSKAPNFYKYLNENIFPKIPDVKSKLSTLKDMMTTWQRQGAENRIIAQIDFKGEHTQIRRMKDKFEKAKAWILKNWNDEFYYPRKVVKEIEKITGKELRPSRNPAVMMEYSKSKAGLIARTFVNDKAVDEYGNIVGPGLTEILKPISNKEMKSFITYGVAKRSEVLEKRGLESGIDRDDAKYIIDKYKNSEWDKAIDGLTEWSNYLLDWVVRAGGLGKEEAKVIRDLNPIYLPFKRAFIEELGVVRGVGGYIDRGRAVKRLKGSGRPIINPIESMVSQANEMISKSQKIRIASIWAEIAEEKDIGGFITEVPAPITARKIRISNIRDFEEMLREVGFEEGKINDLDMNQLATVFFQDWKYMGKDNIVSIWRNGKRKFYELHPELYQALSGMDMVKLPKVIRTIFSPFSRMLRLGATGIKLSFGLATNPFRDSYSTAVFSKRKGATIFDSAIGLYKEATMKPGSPIWRFHRAGGSLAGMMGYDRAATMFTYDELLMDKLSKKGKVLKVVKHPINTLRGMMSFTEMAPRSNEIEKRYEYYKKKYPQWEEGDWFVSAFNDAQDLTVNFTKSGYMAKRVNEVAAFFNVAIRGPEKLYRSLKERPIDTTVKGIAWLTLPALALWWKNRDKEWFKNLPPSYKYNNFFWEIDDKTIVRLPIPFELGIMFCSTPMAALDYLNTKNPEYVKGLMKLIEMQLPDPVPSFFSPLIEVARNKNYLGIPIESEGMKYQYPTERIRHYTTRFAKSLSKGFDNIGLKISPIQIDYMLNSYTGGFMRQIPGKEITEPADIPVLGDLILRMPQNPRRQLNEFFSEWEYLSQRRQSKIASPEELGKYAKIKPLYYYMTSNCFYELKKYREEKDADKVRKVYDTIKESLKDYGYE